MFMMTNTIYLNRQKYTSFRVIYTPAYTGYTEKNGAVSDVNKKCIAPFTRAQRIPSAVATVQVSHCTAWIFENPLKIFI